jgi:hypothetical protein
VLRRSSQIASPTEAGAIPGSDFEQPGEVDRNRFRPIAQEWQKEFAESSKYQDMAALVRLLQDEVM